MTDSLHSSSMTSFSVVNQRVYLVQNMENGSLPRSLRRFRPVSAVNYNPFCDDFGPMNMSCIVDFIWSLDTELSAFPESEIAFCVEDGRRNMTNAVFLLGAYMLLKEGLTPSMVAASFDALDKDLLEGYRDATHSVPDFRLYLIDCWRGLAKGIQQGWVRHASFPKLQWGAINIEEYRYYDNPLNGDLHEVVPGKLVAFKGPINMGAANYRDSASNVRTFSPAYYCSIMHELGVSTIVRLNEPRYDAKDFVSRGFKHFNLEFEDCTSPPDEVVAAFLRIVDAAPGAVAVHCHAGLGRTGTLIAVYLMRSHDFSAREAMGWLRIMRPGSIIGEQQRYLCSVEVALRAARESAAAFASNGATQQRMPSRRPLPRFNSEPEVLSLASLSLAAPPRASDAAAARPSELAAQVKAGMLRRFASFRLC